MNSIKMAGLLQQHANYSPYGVKTKYLSFDVTAGDYVVVPKGLTGGFSAASYESWVNLKSYPNDDSSDGRIIYRDTPLNVLLRLSYRTGVNLRGIQFNLTTTDGGKNITVGSYDYFDLDTWYHIAATYDGTNMRLYVNAVEVGSVAHTGTISTGTGTDTIGSSGGLEQFMDGYIDELRIWDHARTEAQIKQHMNHKLTGWETGLVAYYSMNLGSGSTLPNDQKDGLNDGTIYGATWVNT
jgi:hypothetical protein